MRSIFLSILVVCAASGAAATACADTWRVESDGSGDFVGIQPAVAAAAPGDTILVGPGRYDAMTEWDFDGLWTEDVLVGVGVDSLTIIGASRDEVILGPSVADIVDWGPKGIVVEPSVSMIRVENLRVENVYDGFYVAGGGVLADCTVSGFHYGARLSGAAGLTIRSCSFESGFTGVVVADGTEALLVEDCSVEPEGLGFRFEGASSGTLRRASVQGGVIGVSAAGSSELAMDDCTIEGSDHYNLLAGSALVEVQDSVFGGANLAAVSFSDAGEIRGTGCVIDGGPANAMFLGADTTVELTGCNILPPMGGGFSVTLTGTAAPGAYRQTMTDCFWGFADPDSVAGAIWDAVDNPATGTIVEFLPIAAASVKTESAALGSLKSMFR